MQQVTTKLLIQPNPNHNVTSLLEERLRLTPDRVLFCIPDGDTWQNVTVAEFHAQVVELAKGLVSLGLEPGDRVGCMSNTRYEWTLLDFATQYAGGILIPVYETSSAHQLAWILNDSECKYFIAENEELFSRYATAKDNIPGIEKSFVIDNGAFTELIAQGTEITDAEIARRRQLAKADDIATIIYTSGSSGNPKGCVITHANFVDLSKNACHALSEVVYADDAAIVLFITLAHVFARFISVMCIYAGVRVGHSDTRDLAKKFASFKPSFLLAVPRVFEKVYNSAEQLAESSGKGKIFRTAANVAVAYAKAKEAGKVPLTLRLKFALFDALIFKKIKAHLGGRITNAVSGSAPLSTHLGYFFKALGINILEGYGLTETTAPATVNLPKNYKIGTVGPPLPGVTIRIGENDEVEIKGICVFKEYWKNPELTATVFTPDGFFKTGDKGIINDDGYLKITGRLKEIIVTAGGKNVAPAVLEDVIRANTIISQPVVVGDKQPFIAALITLDTEMLPTWLKNNGLNPDMSLSEAAENELVIAEVQKAIDLANQQVSRAESVRKFKILATEFTLEKDHLTPKMSIKRGNILRDFSSDIAQLYTGKKD